MIEVKNIKVSVEAIDRLTLTWEIDDTVEDVHDYLLNVYRSQSPGGEWDLLASDLEDRYSFTDTTVNLKDRWRDFYYKIVVVTKADTTKTSETTPIGLAAPPDLIALEVRRREALYFRRVPTARTALLFPRRTFGHRCNCWDEVLNRKLVARCLNCFGTGYIKGYLSPIRTWFQIDPSAKANQMSKSAETQQVLTIARTTSFPEIKPKDILVEPENKRWRIVKVMQTERLRAVIRQELHMSAITPGSIEFELPVDFSALENPVEQKYFTRVTTL